MLGKSSSPAVKRTRSASGSTSQYAGARRTKNPSTSSSSCDSPEHKRRVNPESLTARLGPALVKELYSLLKPGVKEMPSFAVRQEIQRRYGINRRHIYDWFHSKGLRVTKEENRIAAEVKKASAYASSRVQREIRVYAPHNRSFSSSTSGCSTKASTPDLRRSPAPPSERDQIDFFSSMAISSFFTKPLYAMPSEDDSSLVSGDHLGQNTTEPDLSLHLVSGGILACAQGSDIGVASSSIVEVAHKDSDDLLHPVTEVEPLVSKAEREAYYECLSQVLGPACGIQESVGTYKSFMNKQTDAYYARLLNRNTSPSYISFPPIVAKPGESVSSSSTRPPLLATQLVALRQLSAQPIQQGPAPYSEYQTNMLNAEFSNWLLYGGRSHPVSHASSPARTPDLCSDAGTEGSTWPFDGTHSRELSGPCLDIADILESPVLRSRNPSSALERSSHGSATTHHFSDKENDFGYGSDAVAAQVPMDTQMRCDYPVRVEYPFFGSQDDCRLHSFYTHSPVPEAAGIPCSLHGNELSRSLQSAKGTYGLDKIMTTSATNKGSGKIKTRLSQACTIPAGVEM